MPPRRPTVQNSGLFGRILKDAYGAADTPAIGTKGHFHPPQRVLGDVRDAPLTRYDALWAARIGRPKAAGRSHAS